MIYQVKMSSGSTSSGTVIGNYGTYTPNSDGTYTVDSRDVTTMLGIGWNYLSAATVNNSYPAVPAAAAVGAIIASASLTNGAVSVTQPIDIRPVQVVIGNGSPGITAGQIAITYIGNDGQTTTDTISAVMTYNTSTTTYLSKGVAHITTAVISALAGGGSPYIIGNTTADLSVPVAAGAVDFTVFKANMDAVDVTTYPLTSGALGNNANYVLGSITPATAPNGTHTYSFAYTYIAPNS